MIEDSNKKLSDDRFEALFDRTIIPSFSFSSEDTMISKRYKTTNYNSMTMTTVMTTLYTKKNYNLHKNGIEMENMNLTNKSVYLYSFMILSNTSLVFKRLQLSKILCNDSRA